MRVVKLKSLQGFESDTHYKGCTFFLEEARGNEDIVDIENCIFENCSFRTNAYFGTTFGCEFNNCNFSNEVVIMIDGSRWEESKYPSCMLNLVDYATEISVTNTLINHIDQDINKFKKLKKLILSDNDLYQESVYFDECINNTIEYIDLSRNSNLITTPDGIRNVWKLKTLVMDNCNLTTMLNEVLLSESLEEIYLRDNFRLRYIPEKIDFLKTLKILDISRTELAICRPQMFYDIKRVLGKRLITGNPILDNK